MAMPYPERKQGHPIEVCYSDHRGIDIPVHLPKVGMASPGELVERTRLAGTAKEAVLLALLTQSGLVPVREIIASINRKGTAASVPAVYRALALLDQSGFIAEDDPQDRQRAIRQFSQRRPAGAKERVLLRYRLTEKGFAMAVMLRLGKSTGPIPAREMVKASHLLFAALQAPESAAADAAGRNRR